MSSGNHAKGADHYRWRGGNPKPMSKPAKKRKRRANKIAKTAGKGQT